MKEQESHPSPKKIFAVDYAGYIHIQTGEMYGDCDLLNIDTNALSETFAKNLVERWNTFKDKEAEIKHLNDVIEDLLNQMYNANK